MIDKLKRRLEESLGAAVGGAMNACDMENSGQLKAVQWAELDPVPFALPQRGGPSLYSNNHKLPREVVYPAVRRESTCVHQRSFAVALAGHHCTNPSMASYSARPSWS
jgi:hypothetical protein